MITLYYWTTPNGHKVSIFLEEAGLPYEIIPIHIGQGDQFKPSFLSISPNNKIPAIVDTAPDNGEKEIALFESGAILEYLADKTGKFMPTSGAKRYECLQWLYWQMGGLGPMLGQNHHFSAYAPEKLPYAIERYVNETSRLYKVLDNQLEGKDFVCGEYSIVDMACYPWIVPYERQQQNLADFPNVKKWFERIKARPAVIRAYAKAEAFKNGPTVDQNSAKVLFGQSARTLS